MLQLFFLLHEMKQPLQNENRNLSKLIPKCDWKFIALPTGGSVLLDDKWLIPIRV